ncbi:MAG: DoxX family protein [Candidatus Woesearchaeota archaeon]
MTSYSITITKIVVSLIFIYQGYMKLFNIGGFAEYLSMLSIPLATFFAVVVALIEFFGGFAILFGVGQRFFASMLALIMIVATLATFATAGYMETLWHLLLFSALLIMMQHK